MANSVVGFKNIHENLWPKDMSQKSIIMCDTGKDDAVMLCCAATNDKTINVNSLITYGGNVNSMRTCNNTQYILSRIGASKDVFFHDFTDKASQDASSVHGTSGLGAYDVADIDAVARNMQSNKVDYSQLAHNIIHSESVNNIISTGPLTGVACLFNALVQHCNGNTALLDAALSRLRLVIMGGVLDYSLGNRGDAEFNFNLDPAAANKTFSFVNEHNINTVIVPLDLTHQCIFAEDDFKGIEVKKTSKEQVFYDLFKKHTPVGRGLEPAHDVHTITCLSNPELYSGEFAKITASEKDGKLFKNGGQSSVFIMTKLDADAFKQTLFSALKV